MKLISWNVNSVRTRLERLKALLLRHQPDLVCLQETKVVDAQFPAAELAALGYNVATWGQKTYNGVALLARQCLTDVTRGFAGNPLPEQARFIAATVGGVRVASVYVVNGQSVGSDAYAVKLRWLDALARSLKEDSDLAQATVLAGDFNIAPTDEDVYDPVLWKGRVLCSAPERERLERLLSLGFSDLHARYGQALSDQAAPIRYTWWDYRSGAFHKDHGLRIDLLLASAALAPCCQGVFVDRDQRKESSGPGKPSDHAPIIALFS